MPVEILRENRCVIGNRDHAGLPINIIPTKGYSPFMGPKGDVSNHQEREIPVTTGAHFFQGARKQREAKMLWMVAKISQFCFKTPRTHLSPVLDVPKAGEIVYLAVVKFGAMGGLTMIDSKATSGDC